jgi:glutathione S-transferase
METLYNVDASYYGAKIRSYLQYKRIPFNEVLGDREVFSAKILPTVGWPVIPVILTELGETLQDTSDMIDHYEIVYAEKSVLPLMAPGRALSYWLELIGDEWLKLPALHYRWRYNRDFVVREMGRNNDPSAPAAEQLRVGKKIAKTFQDWCPIHGITERTSASIETEYLEFLRLFEKHLAVFPYLLGSQPSLGDFAFFGPLYAHLYRDPVSGDLMRQAAPRVSNWVIRMNSFNSQRPTEEGDWVDFEAIPDTLTHLLNHLSRDFVPVIVAEVQALQLWLQNSNDVIMPRYFGDVNFVLGTDRPHEVSEKRKLTTYGQWMLQRVLNVLKSSGDTERKKITRLFSCFGASSVLDITIPVKLGKRNFELVRDIEF